VIAHRLSTIRQAATGSCTGTGPSRPPPDAILKAPGRWPPPWALSLLARGSRTRPHPA
jgi:hypothetical protein